MESHNIMICPRCKLRAIAEEMNVHECRHETDRKIIRNVLGFLMAFTGILFDLPTKTYRAKNFREGNYPLRMFSEDLFARMNSIFSP
jgi:hypothetical protein